MKNRSLQLFLKKSLLLLLVLLILDRLIGSGVEKLFYAQKHGDDAVSAYVLTQAREDIIVMGASRASHHFNTEVLTAATGMSCYNGGRDNMPILYTAAILPHVYQRNSPKVVIIDFTPTELWCNNATYERVASVLLPFAHRFPDLMHTIAMKSKAEIVKTKISWIYPYNSTIGTAFQNAFTHLGHISIKGYEPLTGEIDSANYKEPIWGDFTAGHQTLDTNCISAIHNIIKLTKEHNTRLIGIISPFYFPVDFYKNNSYLELKRILVQNGIELYDFSHDPQFLLKPSLFQDDVHLNDKGATLFDQKIIAILKEKKAAQN